MGKLRFRSHVVVGALSTEGGTKVQDIFHGTVSIDPPSIAADAEGTATATISGAATTDLVFVTAPSNLDAGLIPKGATITSGNTLTVTIANESGGTIDAAAKNWAYLIVRP